MQIVEIDASDWATALDFYNALLVVLGAPRWHGEGIDAFIDSMIYGEINELEPPYVIRVRNTAKVPLEVSNAINELGRFLHEARNEYQSTRGQDVVVSLESRPD